jgi:hypothetical protein
LAETLVHLHPTGLDRMRGAQCIADIVGPDISGETIVAVIGHTDRIRLVTPRDRHEHRAEDLLARQAPVVGGISEYGRDREIPFAERSLLGRQAAKHPLRLFAVQTLLDIGTHLAELLFVDDAADIGCLVQWVAEFQQRRPVPQFLEKAVEDIGMQEQARSRSAGLALSREAHRCDDAVDHPILVGVGVDD